MTATDVLAAGLLVIANEGADPHALGAAVEQLRTRHDTEVVTTATPGQCADELVSLGARVLVVAGGDGTLSNAVSAMHAQGVLGDSVLGLLPLGTGNDFARTVGLPLDPVEAAAVISAGVTRTLDLILDDGGGIVVNAIHGGIGAEAARESARFKDAIGPAAYPIGAALAGAAGDPTPVRVRVDDAVVFDASALMVGVANGRTIGGGAPLAPDAEPDDGLLDVVVVAAETLPEKIGFAKDLRTGTHTDRDDVLIVTGRQVEITGEAMRYNADGDISELRTAARFTLLPSSWRLLVPPSGPGSAG